MAYTYYFSQANPSSQSLTSIDLFPTSISPMSPLAVEFPSALGADDYANLVQAMADMGYTEVPSGSSGTGVVDFGAAPGGTTATLVVTGQSFIVSTSVVQAWIVAAPTADHSIDEHLAEMPAVSAGSIVAGTGFTIYAAAPGRSLYGQYSVGWRWA